MADLPGKIHRYEVVDRLGRGGMGELYLARDPLLDRLVAIKVLRTGFEGSDLRERFAREARSAARLAHINIVTIFDVGEHDGQPYIAMEYVRGETLFQQIQRKVPLPLSTKLQYIDELCAGLGHAHKAGIVHRDIKPANLIISADGALKILDFGIARLADSNMTQEGSVMGTLNYMSPEQLTGQPIDHRSDIFAVGAVFYELLTYQQAFPGGIDSGVLSRIIDGRFTPFERVDTRVDRNLARIVERAMAKEPNERFEDLKHMREELARVRQRLDSRTLAAFTSSAADGETVAIETPVATPRTPRRGTNREEIQRRRAEELAAYLDAARDAFKAGRFEEASAACERALILDPESEEALELSERAREAIEQSQVREWLGEAQNELQQGNLGRARDLVSRVFSLDANSAAGNALRIAIQQAERQNQIDEILGRGRLALESGDADAAFAALDEAFAIDPEQPQALALRRQVETFVEQEQRRAEEERARVELERRAQEVIPEARRRFDNGDMDGAIALLAAFAPPHPDVASMLGDLRAEAQVIREREAERQRQLTAELSQARASLANGDLTGAVSAVARARGIAPTHAEVAELGRAIEIRRAEIAAQRKAEEEARRQAALEAKRKAEEEARRKAAEDKQRKAREHAEREAAAAAKRQAEEEARRRAEEERQRKVQEELRRNVEQEAQRKVAAPAATSDTVLLDGATIVPRPPGARADDTVAVTPPAMPLIAPSTPTIAASTPTIQEGASPRSASGFIAAAVLALAVIGGAAYWLMSGDAPESPSSPAPMVTTAPDIQAAPPQASTPARSAPTSAPAPTSLLVIDAAPWAEILEVSGANGTVPITATHTPMAVMVPEGEYKITLRNPNEAAPRVLTATVRGTAPTRAFAEFTPVDVDDYFRRSGS